MTKILICAALAAALMAGSGPAFAQSEKLRACATSGKLAGAVQQARLEGVSKRNLRGHVAAANPDLSEALLDTLPQWADQIYAVRKRDLRAVDMRALAEEQCVANWDQIKAMQDSLSN